VLTLQRGFDLPERLRREGPFPIVSSSGITGFHAEARATGPGVVTGRYGTLGEVFYVLEDFWPLNTALFVRDFKGNDPRYCAYLLRTLGLGERNAAGAVPGVNRNHLHLMKVRTPQPRVQRRIASILAAYDDLIENNTKRIKILEEMARSLYREWFVNFRFPGHEKTKFTTSKLGRIPEGWSVRPLRECATFLSGGTPSKARPGYWEGDIPWVSSGELTAFRLHRTQLHLSPEGAEAGSRIVPPGTILAVVRGMSLAREFRIGITALEMAFNQDLKAIVSAPDLDTLVLFHALDERRDEIRDRSTEAAHGTKKLDSAVLEQLPIPIPPRSLQKAFKEHVGPLHAQWDCLDQKNHILRPTRDLLLPRLISGEIDVSSLRLESAAS
jgi:type I restriction enzyme S subunit